MLICKKEGIKLHTQALNILCTYSLQRLPQQDSHYPAFLGQPSL